MSERLATNEISRPPFKFLGLRYEGPSEHSSTHIYISVVAPRWYEI